MVTTRTINVANANAERYLWDLRSAYYGIRVWDPDFALQRDPYIFEKMVRDPTVRQCLSDRVRAIAGGGFSVDPPEDAEDADEGVAKIIRSSILGIDNLVAGRVSLAKFVWEGTRHALVEGRRERRPYGDGTVRRWWVPTRLRDINKRRIRVEYENGVLVRKIARVTNLRDTQRVGIFDPFPPDRIITAVYEDEESRLGFGRGLADSCYWPFYILWKLYEWALEAAPQWASGITVVSTDTAAIGDTTQDTEDTRDALISAVKNAKARGIIAKGKDDDLEIFHGEGTQTQSLLALAQTCKDDIRMLLTGSKLPSGGGGDQTGSMARAEVELEVSEGITQLDSAILDEALTRHLVRPIFKRNAENFRAVGLGDGRCPVFRSGDEKTESHSENAKLIFEGMGAGLKFRKDEAYARIGMSPPTDEDEESGNIVEGAPMGGDPFGGTGRDDGRNEADDPFAGMIAEFSSRHFRKEPKR